MSNRVWGDGKRAKSIFKIRIGKLIFEFWWLEKPDPNIVQFSDGSHDIRVQGLGKIKGAK